jgi:glycosyltransferase involved in cell wall biosynthesis
MKALIFTSHFVHGAAERLGAELAVDLNQLGVHADVMSMYTTAFPGAISAADELIKRGVPKLHFLGLSPHPSPLSLIAAIFRLNKLIRQERYDILETSSTTPGLLAAWAITGTKARHIVGLHLSYDDNTPSPRSTKAFRWSVHLHSRAHFYAVSNSAKRSWEAYTGTPEAYVEVVYNCIQERYFHGISIRRQLCQELGVSTTSRLILCAGRIAPYKQQDHLIDAIAPICEANDLVVLFVGDADATIPGSTAMLAQMIETVRKRGLTKRFHFLGYRSDLDALMASCDLFVHPAAKEAFGLVLAEALAAGLPIVSTDTDGTREVLEHTNSIMVPTNDVPSLQKGIITALSKTPEALAAMIAIGKTRASQFKQRDRTLRMLRLFQKP